MGIIKRQGTKHSLIQYFGVLISAVSTLFVYPLDTEVYGLLQFLISSAFLLFSFSNLGLHAVLLKFFPRINKVKTGGIAFFWSVLILSIVFVLLFTFFLSAIEVDLVAFLRSLGFGQSDLLEQHFNVLLILSILTTIVVLLRHQAMNHKRIAIPTVIIELSLKFFLPFAVLASAYLSVTHEAVTHALLWYEVAVVAGLLIYLLVLKAISFRFTQIRSAIRQLFTREVASFGIFSSMNRLGTILAFRIDAVMVTLFLGAASNGIYFIFLFMANVIQIPYRSLSLIGIPMISQAWEKGDKEEIQNIYSKSALNLSLISISIFLFLWFSLPDILLISPKSDELMVGMNLFLFLGLARVTDSITSLNEPILNYSRHYKYGLVFILCMGAANAVLNYYLIQAMGLTGAAIATFLSYSIYNLTKLIFLKVTYGFMPWSKKMIWIMIFGFFTMGLLWLIQLLPQHFYRIILNGLAVLIAFLIPLIRLKISPDFNQLLVLGMGKVPIIGKILKGWVRLLTDK